MPKNRRTRNYYTYESRNDTHALTDHVFPLLSYTHREGKFGVPNSPTYCATKHALHGYFESLRYESYGKNVQVTMVCPGPVFSNLVERAFTGKPGETYGLVHGNDMKRN